MTGLKLKRICLFLFCCLASFEGLLAQTTESWWLNSSLVDSVRVLRLHANGSCSYTRMQGVISGKTVNNEILLAARKGVFTNFARYGTDRFDMKLKSMVNLNYATDAYYFTDYLNADFTKLFYAELGYIWERNSAFQLRNRYTFYGGIGINANTFGKLRLKSLVATGRIDQEYTVSVDGLNVVKGPYQAFYCIHDANYILKPDVIFMGKFYYFTDLKDTNRYRLGYTLNLKVGIARHLNLMFGYNYNFDKELSLLGLVPDNSTQHAGLELSF